MEAIPQSLPGVVLLVPSCFADQRGTFVKTYNSDRFADLGLKMTVKEEFYSDSRRHVIRGMHFQVPPHDHEKLVFCVRGRILDVVLDLRRSLPSYGQCLSFELSAENRQQVYVPRGMAHGFAALEDASMVFYKTSSVYSPPHDQGVRWDSFGFEWAIPHPVISDRDRGFPPLSAFASPF